MVWYGMTCTQAVILLLCRPIQSAAATRNDNNDIYNSKEQHALE